MATRAQITVNGVVGSNDNVTLNVLVQLNNNGLGDESTYDWTIISQPSGSPNAVLSSSTIQAPTFTPNKEGSYLVMLVVNKDLPDEKVDRIIVAVRELETLNRIPAAGETTENNAETGWANTAVDQILQRVTRFADQGVLVGKAGVAGLLPLDVVYVTDVVTIATGLPGQREVPQFGKAEATSTTKVRGLVGVLLGGVDGSPAPDAGSLVRVLELGLIRDVPLGTAGQPDGTPVYVDDTARLSLTPGTVIRQVGTTLDDMGAGSYGVYITGESSFGTLQDVDVTAPLTKVPGVVPLLGLNYDTGNLRVVADALDLTETTVTAGTYGDGAPAYPTEPASLIPQFTVDAYGRLTAAGQTGATIGGMGAKTYVDNGDAATLAAAEAFATALSYGMSSKVPVHVATVTALPANTANAGFTTLTANVHGPLGNIDGHTLLVGERILVKNEAAQANNGIYVLTQAGSSSGPSQPWIMTRAADADTGPELCGSLVSVNVGTVNAGSTWLFAYNPTTFVLGTTPVVFTQQNAIPATDTVYGTVKLAGGLGGTGSLAAAPVLALGTGYVSGVLPFDNGGTGLSSVGAPGNVLVSTGTGWMSGGVPAAEATVTGGVRLAGVLAGTGSTALLPVAALGTGYVSGVLPATNGGTGLSASDSEQHFLIGDGSGGWTQRVFYESDSLLAFPGATISRPIGLIGTEWINTTEAVTGNFIMLAWNDASATDQMVLQPGTRLSNDAPLPAAIGDFFILGGSTSLAGGIVTLRGGFGTVSGGIANLIGGRGNSGGNVNVLGGDAIAGTGGTVLVKAGATTGGADGVTATLAGGDASAVLEGNGGTAVVEGGDGYIGGAVLIQPGAGTSEDGEVRIRRRAGSVSGRVLIDDAYVNGTGTAGQVFTSRGASLPPSWEDLGGAPGPASQGAFKTTSVNYTITTDDFLVYGIGGGPGPFTITLPAGAGVPTGRIFYVKAGTTGVTLAAAAGEQIDTSNGPWALALWEVRRVMRTTGVGSEWIFI